VVHDVALVVSIDVENAASAMDGFDRRQDDLRRGGSEDVPARRRIGEAWTD
jgi:hypothetical protein